MKRYTIFLILLKLFISQLYSQCADCEFKEGEIWVIIDEKNVTISEGIVNLNDTEILNIFLEHKASQLIPVFPYSKKELLGKVYKIYFEGPTNQFVEKLTQVNQGQFEGILKRPKENRVIVYDPSDYMWQTHKDDWLWHLSDLQADLAWDITKSDTSVKVAILDTWFDINHPDLENQIDPHYDPYDITYFNTNCARNNHGTGVASYVAAETDGGGQLAGMGFDSRLICYQAWDSDYLERAHHASLAMGADVLTSSAGGWDCRNSTL